MASKVTRSVVIKHLHFLSAGTSATAHASPEIDTLYAFPLNPPPWIAIQLIKGVEHLGIAAITLGGKPNGGK